MCEQVGTNFLCKKTLLENPGNLNWNFKVRFGYMIKGPEYIIDKVVEVDKIRDLRS